MKRVVILIAVLASLAWAAAVAYEAWLGWPHLSLDLSQADAGTQRAYQQAIIMHVVRYAAVGLAPLAVVSAAAAFIGRAK